MKERFEMFQVEDLIYDCPVEALANILGKKWVATIIWQLQKDKKRFGELQRLVEGCTKKMLSQQLDLLISQGIIINEKVNLNNSVESTYYLSASGLKLLPLVETMINWGNIHLSCQDGHKKKTH